MDIFICWSGMQGQQFAEDTRDFLKQVLPEVNFALSSDFEMGSLWMSELIAKLRQAQAGIVCLTPHNLTSPWMHFEVGALFSPKKPQPIFVVTLGVQPEELKEPFKHFHATATTREDMEKLIAAIAKLDQGLVPDHAAIDAQWPAFEKKLARSTYTSITQIIKGFGAYREAKTFRLPLKKCPDQGWRARYVRVNRTIAELNAARPIVEKRLSAAQSAQFGKLISTMDEYKRLLEQLVPNRKFKVVGKEVDFSQPLIGEDDATWVSDACEDQRKTIEELTKQLIHPQTPEGE